MYKLKDVWPILHGEAPIPEWNGKMVCVETDAEQTFRTNEIRGFLSSYSFTLVLKGWLTILYNGRELTLMPNDIYMYSPGMSVTVLSASENYRGICLIVDEDITLEMPTVRNLATVAYAPLVELSEPKVSLLSDSARLLHQRMMEIIECQHSSHLYREEVLRLLYAIFLLDLMSAQRKAIPQHRVPHRVEEIFMGFIRLLPHHFVEHHDIGFYASELNITTDYLSRIVKRISGRTVIDYINQMLVMEAQWLLHTSTYSVSQIAERLHFADSASFSKFFSRQKGITPREYRANC